MSSDYRREMERLEKEFRQRRETPDGKLFLGIVDMKLKLAKDALVACRAEDFPLLQGEARAYEKLLRLERDKPVIPESK